MTEGTIYIATSNAGKLRDFAAAAKLKSVEVLPLPGFSEMPSVAEDGETFEANARKKAEHYSRLFPGNLVLGDDSGLEVRALGGAPGVYSARFAAEDASLSGNAPDEANNRKLLSLLASSNDRAAHFVAVIAVSWSGVSRNGNECSNSRCHFVSGPKAWPSCVSRSAWTASIFPA